MTVDYKAELNAAVEAARVAGEFLRQHFDAPKTVNSEFAHDLKLQLDKDTQQLITQRLRAAFPSYSVLGEEGETGQMSAEAVWIVDPIDGTVNYFYGIPLFCVSIALQVRGKLVLGCVYDPMRDECFTAIAGSEACLNGRPVRVSPRQRMAEAVVFIGHGRHDGSGEAGIRRFAHISAQVRKIRILGTAALAICYIAAGRFDAYIENRINLWDFAAARVILESAGGCLDFEPDGVSAYTGSVIAWNGALPIHEALQLPE